MTLYRPRMSSRARILTFGSAAVFVLAGGLCSLLVKGVTGEVLSLILVSVGAAGAVLLAFLEVGLSEDRERAADEERRRRGGARLRAARRRWRRGQPRRPR